MNTRNSERRAPLPDRKNQLGGTERVALYRALHKNPLSLLENSTLLDHFYILFGKPLINTVTTNPEDIHYIWYLPPVVAAVGDGAYRFDNLKRQMLYYTRKEKKKPITKSRPIVCKAVRITYDQALALTRSGDVMHEELKKKRFK